MFWGELSACDHCVQIYEDDVAFLDALEGFVAGGIRQGDAIILIATPGHLQGLEKRLGASGFDVGAAIQREKAIHRAGRERVAVDRFMVDGWPDEVLFAQFIDHLLLTRARGQHRKGARIRRDGRALMWPDTSCNAAYPNMLDAGGFRGSNEGVISKRMSSVSHLKDPYEQQSYRLSPDGHLPDRE